MGSRITASRKRKKQLTTKIKQWLVVLMLLLIIGSMVLVDVSYIFM